MKVEIIVDKLPQYVRAGDIVGAFANEAQIDGSRIGKIRINRKRGRAFVQIDEEVVEIVMEMMNQRQISGADIEIAMKDNQELQKINLKNYINKFKNLLYQERQEALVKNRLEIRHMNGLERQTAGRALLKLNGKASGFPVENVYHMRFTLEETDDELPLNEFMIGDLIIVSTGEPLAERNLRGIVTQIEPTAITIRFEWEPLDYVYGNDIRIDLYAHDQTFQQALCTLKSLSYVNPIDRLVAILLGTEEPELSEKRITGDISYLDDDQLKILKKALKAKDIFLIQGDAGTGKTTVGAEILLQHLKSGYSVLAVGTSPMSRDRLAETLTKLGLKVLKLDELSLKMQPEYNSIQHLLKAVQKLMKRRDELAHPKSEYIKKVSYAEILAKGENGQSYADIPSYHMREMADWIKLQRRIDKKLSEVRNHQNKIWTRLLKEHDLICGTHEEAIFLREKFDFIVIDDAHMISEPEILPVFLKAKKVILLGDEKQIGPKVFNLEAKMGGLDKSLFHRFLEELDDEWIGILQTQHRVNLSTWRCLGEVFSLGTSLEFHPESSLVLTDWKCGPSSEVLEDVASVVFIDTSNIPIEEVPMGEEYYNLFEVDLICEFFESSVDLEIMSDKTAVLTFYSAQAQMIRQTLNSNKIDFSGVYTIDEICGCEKNLVIISLVHSNSTGYLGKTGSVSHLITALTRSKEKCIIIGNLNTLSSHPIYQKLLASIRQRGKVYTL